MRINAFDIIERNDFTAAGKERSARPTNDCVPSSCPWKRSESDGGDPRIELTECFSANVLRLILLLDWDHPSVPTCMRYLPLAQRRSRMVALRPPRERRVASLTAAGTVTELRVSRTSRLLHPDRNDSKPPKSAAQSGGNQRGTIPSLRPRASVGGSNALASCRFGGATLRCYGGPSASLRCRNGGKWLAID